MRVLVVDDEFSLARMYEVFLARAGHDPVVSTDPYQALELLGSDIDAIVSDIEMPGMDGVEMVTRMRRGWPDVPVVFVTGADPHSETWLRASAYGPVVAKTGNFKRTMDEILQIISQRHVGSTRGAYASTPTPPSP